MHPLHPPLSDVAPIRNAYRAMRRAFKEKQAQLETKIPALLPGPTARVAHVLIRDMGHVARGVDGLLTGLAHRVLHSPETSFAEAGSHASPLQQGLERVNDRLSMHLGPMETAHQSPVFTGSEWPGTPTELADRLLDRLAGETDPQEQVRIFACVLAITGATKQDTALTTVSQSAADLAYVLREPVHAALQRRDTAAISALVEKYAAHV